MRYTINLDCKTNHVGRDGKFPISLRISLNGVNHYINTGRRIKNEHYDRSTKSVKSGITGYSTITSFINRQKERIEGIINDFDIKGETPTISKIKSLYNQASGKVESLSFYDFVEDKIRWEEKNTQIKKSTLKNYKNQLIKIKRYKKKLSIHDIDENFLRGYKTYILDTMGNADNTAYHAMCFLRKYTKMLFEDGKIKPYPFANFTVGSTFEANRDYLEIEELNILHDLYDSKELLKIVKKYKTKFTKDFEEGKKMQEVLRYFLVSCYTGLRHSDIKTLTRKDIQGNFIVKVLRKDRERRKKTVRIPIRKRLLSLLEMDNSNEFIFENPVQETSSTNKYLKKIMGIAKIEKHITFHCARHSFAIISLMLEIPIEVISNILGHSEISTTQRYARIVDKVADKGMDKWDKLEKDEFFDDDYLHIYCTNCENLVFSLKKNVIKLDNILCECQICSTPFSFNLKGAC